MNYRERRDDVKTGADPICAARLLLAALTTPSILTKFELNDWNSLIRQARRTNLLSRVAVKSEELGIIECLPQKVADSLHAALYLAANNRRVIEWEIRCIRRALENVNTPIILLKGAAYAAAKLPAADGRIAGDIDIMVSEERLSEVEAALLANGWSQIKFSDYDQRYYRKWSHELPPLVHDQRRTVIDVHHTILPRTSRLKPDVSKLWQRALDLDDVGMKVLGHQDMVLHSAAHLFQDGDLGFAIRDLVDLADLLNFFGKDPEFSESLVDRAYEHQLQRPLFYAMRYCQMLLDLNVPETVAGAISSAAPAKPILGLMDRTIPRALLPDDPDSLAKSRANAATMLYLRSHWLRMPPWLLAAHLTRKSVMQFVASLEQKREEKQNQQ